ncbi:MAG: hypothetical protein ABI644_12580 [Arenimonas sp.]
MNPELNLSWKRFIAIIVAIWLIVALIVWPAVTKSGWHAPDIAMILFALSISVFFTFRFHRLRATLGERSEMTQTLSELRSMLMGPTLFAYLWFGGTLAVIFSVIIVAAS